MSKIPQEIVDRINADVSIVDEVKEDVALRKVGINYVGCCPFHDDHHASFYVNPARNICKCFACGEGGNVVSYRMKHDGLSFPEAVRLLGKRHGIDVPEVELTPEQQKENDDRESIRVVLTRAAQEFQRNYDKTAEAQAYVAARGISAETVAVYGVGFAFDFDGLTKNLLAAGCQSEYLVAAGVSWNDEDKGKLRDAFWQRILFPFFDKRGQVVGFTGRAINDQKAKYKNTGETPVFTKGKNIYGLYQARNAIQKADKVYVVEGQFDVLSFAEVGVKNVVAGSGTAFTADQRHLLKGFTQNVVFVYDGDRAGQAAAVKHLPELVRDGFRVRCIALPDGQDPNDLMKAMRSQLTEYIRKAETGYVEFMKNVLLVDGQDDYARLEAIKQILAVIACERDTIIRQQFTGKLADLTGIDVKQLEQMAEQVKLPEQPAEFQPGFYGIEEAHELLMGDDDAELHLTSSFDSFLERVGKRIPCVFWYGRPDTDAITNLLRVSNNFIVHRPNWEADRRHESDDILLLKELFKRGCTVETRYGDEPNSLVYCYLYFYQNLIEETNRPEEVNEYIGRCAELMSYANEGVLTINLPRWAEILKLKASQLKDILRPYLNERKSAKRMSRERSFIDEELVGIDTERVPDYVEDSEEYMKMLKRYGFFPVIRKKDGTPVCYMFKTDNNSFRRVGDFYIVPLFHVYAPNKEDNRRVIKLNRMYVDKPTYVEWPSSVFAKLSTFSEMLINEGAYNFENGTAQDYARIWNCISYNFPKCTELKVFGQQPENCFCFANGIYHEVGGEWKFELADELGLMRHGDDIFYSPAFSVVNAGARQDNDRYEQDRWLAYKDTPQNRRITFERWAQLMNEVYGINDNGKWAIIYSIMCAFRSDIWPIARIFTSLFFLGPTMSGKTQIALSIRSLFISPLAPSFNLNSGTDAAFFSVLERFRDVPQIMEEYNDDMISDRKFQGLKSVVYDGEGAQKRKSASTNDIEVSKVHAPVILLGQESPQKDDNALTNRVVLCEVPKSESINTEHAQQIFRELKAAEEAGLSYLLLEVLKLRPVVRQFFRDIQQQCARELQSNVESTSSRSGEQARLIATMSMFLAMCKLIEQHAPHLPLPFTYNEFLRLAVEKVRSQISMLTRTDKLAVFFSTVDTLIDSGRIRQGRDFKIATPGTVTLTGGVAHSLKPADTQVLYMNLKSIHQMYASAVAKDGKPLSLSTLEINLKSHPSYIGQVNNTRFKWLEAVEAPVHPEDEKDAFTGAVVKANMTMTRIMQSKTKVTSAVALNYDILRRTMDIDFERSPMAESDSLQPAAVHDQPQIPF